MTPAAGGGAAGVIWVGQLWEEEKLAVSVGNWEEDSSRRNSMTAIYATRPSTSIANSAWKHCILCNAARGGRVRPKKTCSDSLRSFPFNKPATAYPDGVPSDMVGHVGSGQMSAWETYIPARSAPASSDVSSDTEVSFACLAGNARRVGGVSGTAAFAQTRALTLR